MRDIDCWRKVLDIIEKKSKNPEYLVITSAGHDQIWINLSEEEVPEDSEDGKFLNDAGFFIDDEAWSCFV